MAGEEAEMEVCAICLDDVLQHELGLGSCGGGGGDNETISSHPSSCRHLFHFSCIKSWSEQNNT